LDVLESASHMNSATKTGLIGTGCLPALATSG